MRRPGEVNRLKRGVVAPPLGSVPVRGGDGCGRCLSCDDRRTVSSGCAFAIVCAEADGCIAPTGAGCGAQAVDSTGRAMPLSCDERRADIVKRCRCVRLCCGRRMHRPYGCPVRGVGCGFNGPGDASAVGRALRVGHAREACLSAAWIPDLPP